MTDVADAPARPDLAATPDFALGGLAVRPSLCEVVGPEGRQRVEPRVMEVLLVLVAAQARTVSRDELIDACWDGRIVSDDAIARIIAKVRALSRLAEPAPFALTTIPKVGFRLLPADTPDAPAVMPPAAAPVTPRRRWLALTIAAVAAVGLAAAVAGFALWRGQAGNTQSGRVEVVRFEAREPDPALVRLSAELGDAMVRTLAGSGVETSPSLASPDAGASGFDAEFRVVGSVAREGDARVVEVQVLDRRRGLVVLTLRRTRPAAAMEGFADEVAVSTAGILNCGLQDRRWSRRRMEPSVLALYLNTCSALGNPPRMVQAGRRLVEAAPDLAIGHAMYAIAQAHAQDTAATPAEAAAFARGARASGERALKLDPRTPKAHLAIALSYPRRGAWLEQERHFLAARAIDPQLSPGRIGHIELLQAVGRIDEAARLANELVAAGDPRNLHVSRMAQMRLAVQTEDLPRARRLAAALQTADPDSANAVRWFMIGAGDPGADLRELDRVSPEGINPRSLECMRAFLQARVAGRTTGLPPACDRAPPERRLRMLAQLGDVDAVYTEATRSGRLPDPYVFFHPEMKAVRADPRFMPLAARLGLTDYWLRSGKWPDFCAEPDLPYDCRLAAAAQNRSVSPAQNRRPTTS